MSIFTGVIKREIETVLSEKVPESLKDLIIELKDDSMYILIVPENLDGKELKEAFRQFQGKSNLLVLQANGVRLLELTHGE